MEDSSILCHKVATGEQVPTSNFTKNVGDGKEYGVAGVTARQDSMLGRRLAASKLSQAFKVMIWSLEVNGYFGQTFRKIKDVALSTGLP